MSDLIDRQAAIGALKEHRALFCDNTPDTFSKLSYAEKSRVDELDMAIATLINLPSAQPERETGKWVKTKDSEWSGGGCYTCSNCSLGISFELFGLMTDWNYCPNCGAWMEAEG